MKQFYLSELPPTLAEFKSATMEIFPNIFDTLLMVRNEPLKSLFLRGNALGDVYKRSVFVVYKLKLFLFRVHMDPFTLRSINVSIPAGYRDYRTFGGQCHEAGYDAFMTGISFIRMFGYLNNLTKTKEIFNIDLPIAGPFLNRISTNRFYDIHHITMSKPADKLPNRNHCFHVQCPEDWVTNDIYGK